MSASPTCIKCGDYIHHGPVVCEPCFFNVEVLHKSEMDVQTHRMLAALNHILPKMRAALFRKMKGSRNIYGQYPHKADVDEIREMQRDVAIVSSAIARAEGEDR